MQFDFTHLSTLATNYKLAEIMCHINLPDITEQGYSNGGQQASSSLPMDMKMAHKNTEMIYNLL